MGISRIELQGQVMRAQDFQTIKHQEDSRGSVQQTHIQAETQKQETVKLTRVQNSDATDTGHMQRHDASEKGRNEYAGDGGRGRKEGRDERAAQAASEEDGKVLLKSVHTRKVEA